MEALLAISNDFLILLDQEAKAVVFNCATKDVIGWTLSSPASLKIFYERGESVSLRSISNNTEDFKEVVKRLEVRTHTKYNTHKTGACWYKQQSMEGVAVCVLDLIEIKNNFYFHE